MHQSQRHCNPELTLLIQPSRRIVLPIEQSDYPSIVEDRKAFRAWVDTMYTRYPELFPADFTTAYHLHDMRQSRKLPDVSIRRIRLPHTDEAYRVVPSFVLPYMPGCVAFGGVSDVAVDS